MPAMAQEWLRWQETPLSGERDPGKRAPPPPQARPAMQAPVERVPLRTLARGGASQPVRPGESATETAAPQQAAAGPPTPAPSSQPEPAPPLQIAKAGRIASVARSQPATAPIAAPVIGRPETAALFALQGARQPVVTALRIPELDPRFAPPKTTAPMMRSMPIAKQAPIPLSAVRPRRLPLPERVPTPRIGPPATAGSPPPMRGSQTVVAALRIDDLGAPLARPRAGPSALPSPVSQAVPGIAVAAAHADDAAALPPCVLRMRRASAAGPTGIAYLPRSEASQPCPAAVDAAALDAAQRGSGGGQPAPQQAYADLLRDMLRGR